MSRILVIDNYDSFVYTIVGYLQQLGAQTTVVRNDDESLGGAEPLAGYDGVLVSPGPGTPKEAGESTAIIERCAEQEVPMLGVCLGHQALGEVFGGVVNHSPELMHGKTSEVEHDGTGVFASLPSPFTATRYHSLAVQADTVPDVLRVTGHTANGIVMGLEHRSLPLHGVQFHPESVLTEGGHRLLANWLALAGDGEAVARSAGLAPLVTPH
ncbi:aminodeoxychorismate/anthranilate synthase component II [Occultella glacieicola]|uniref:Aminodeoxychorismate/anthranilate synthase component II n=1 Tax=Occultella glacieicola TaxID=2518684 RepID=A0ABY2E8M2_9MICO|nr:aminodeoxychorismate/anthranilate synthase component II [Occultella glacieicola]TDE98731.1 aminodeoxychorismate/anthranilate synthase component II [Occultella glacieicola]